LKYLPYGRQTISEEDIAAVVEVLRSEWLTTGPAVDKFENNIAEFTGARHAVALSSGTAALHAIMHALGIVPGDEVIVSPMTFAATSNAVVYCGGTPVFADIKPGSLLIDPACVRDKLTARTRAIVAVDYAGQPCDYDELREIADRHHVALVSDACHSLGVSYKGRKVGGLADLSSFSFHAVKNLTTGEGGMVTTDDAGFAKRIRSFRNHGITTDHRQRAETGSYAYDMVELGFNYRITDLQCALGSAQLGRLPRWLKQRASIAQAYDEHFREMEGIRVLDRLPDRDHAYHLYVIEVDSNGLAGARDHLFATLRQEGIGCNVHYRPVYLHPYYRERLGYRQGLCPHAEAAYEWILSIPMFPQMEGADVSRVVQSLRSALVNQ
jgi:perosamine synthetase